MSKEFFTCVETGVPFYCAFCGKPIDPSVTDEGFVITGDNEVLHIECYIHTKFKKRLLKLSKDLAKCDKP